MDPIQLTTPAQGHACGALESGHPDPEYQESQTSQRGQASSGVGPPYPRAKIRWAKFRGQGWLRMQNLPRVVLEQVAAVVGVASTSHSLTCLIGLHWSPATPLDIQPGGAGVHWSPVETQWTPTKSSPPQPTPIGLQPKSNQVQPTLSRLQGEMFGSDWTPTRLQLESNETLATSVFYATVGCVRNHYLSHSCHQSLRLQLNRLGLDLRA